MRVGSLFAGIGGFDLGFERAGMRTAWQVELDPKCRELLARRFPEAQRFEDVTECGAHNLAPVDVVCGGFPCQDLSVAGKRAGLAGARSGLFYQMTRIVDELKPAWLVWENVPGLLSSHRGSDFAAVLVELERIGYGGAWTTLDARYFGVAQRRRRIFGVFARGDTGEGRAASVLALAARLRGNPAPREEAGPRTAVASISGLGSGGADDNDAQAGRLAYTINASPRGTGPNSGNGHNSTFVTPTLQAGSPTYERGDGSLFCGPRIVGQAMSSKWAKGTSGPAGDECHNLVPLAHSLEASDGHHGRSSPRGDGCDNLVPTLRVGGRDQGAGDSYDNTPIVAMPLRSGRQFSDMGDGQSNVNSDPSTEARMHVLFDQEDKDAGTYEADAASVLSVLRRTLGTQAFEEWGSRVLDSLQSPEVLQSWLHGESLRCSSESFRSWVDDSPLPRQKGSAGATLRKVWCEGPDGRSSQGRGLAKQLAYQLGKTVPKLPPAAAQRQQAQGVRRLTPVECCRLQGFPDDWLDIEVNGKPLSDTHRYRMLGNAVAVPCAAWIGRRLAQEVLL